MKNQWATSWSLHLCKTYIKSSGIFVLLGTLDQFLYLCDTDSSNSKRAHQNGLCLSLRPTPSSSLLLGSTCRALYLLCQGTWERGVATEEMHLLCQTGTCRHWPLSLRSLCSAMWREDRESSVSRVLSVCWACPRDAMVQFQ